MTQRITVFAGMRRIAGGDRETAARAVASLPADATTGPVLAFDDATGRVVDLDLRAPETDGPHADGAAPDAGPDAPRGRGRPRLGVVPREVTLLPRHWDWLATRRGGASATLRRLVEQAMRDGAASDRARQARDAAYAFMQALAGDLPGYEEALRALYAGDGERFTAETADWPEDVRAHAAALAADGIA